MQLQMNRSSFKDKSSSFIIITTVIIKENPSSAPISKDSRLWIESD